MGRIVVVVLLLMLAAAGCSAIPADPDDTLERVTGDTLRVGVSVNPPWTDLPEGADGDPVGTEAELVVDFAATVDAEIEWETGGEENLIGQLAAGDLDLVIGGLTADSPWQDMAALTRPYTENDGDGEDDGGEQVQRVMATPAGENAFLAALERFLAEQGQGQTQASHQSRAQAQDQTQDRAQTPDQTQAQHHGSTQVQPYQEQP